jgi:hypothetical protein
MVKIIEQGTIPAPPAPWYLDSDLICPNCQTKFRLEAEDLESPENMTGAWNVVTERSLDGRQIVSGPCPYCQRPIRIERDSPQQNHLAKKAAAAAMGDLRASLPAEVRGWRWAKKAKRATWAVAAFPIGPNGVMEVATSPGRVHAVMRQDGQIRTDMTTPMDALGPEWIGSSEPEAAILDAALVEFVNRLGLVTHTAPRPMNGGY